MLKPTCLVLGAALVVAGCQGAPAAAPPSPIPPLWLRVQAPQEAGDAVVPGAAVKLEDLAGRELGPAATTDERGLAALPAPPPEAPGVVAAYFGAAGKTYRVAAMIPKGGARGPVEVGPATTMIALAARAAAIRKPDAPQLSWDALTRARELCDRAHLDAFPELLAYTPGAASTDERLVTFWHTWLSHVDESPERAELLRFAIDLEELGDGPPPAP